MQEKNPLIKEDNRFRSSIIIYCLNIVSSVKNGIAKKINRIESKLDYPFNKNPKSFDDLTPTIIKDEVTYTSALFWALKNKNIKNVALTGSYGSGKSSIIKTFKNRYKEFDYLNISLATFEELNDKEQDEVKNVAKKTKEEKEEREILNQKIELSILQQMLYIERSNKLPNSRFKRIKNFKRHNVILNTAFAFITVLGYVFLFQRELILKICLTHNFFIINADILEIISGIFMLIGIFYLVKSFVKAFSDFKFSKINLKGDVELNREVNDNSILNKNLDEIIYFFERTNYNVVFIEDLDRFKEPEIFTKLREINLLINLSKQVNRHIVFVYALKDEMFVDGNRTKFFDFIIPIIPVINSSNSFEFLYEKLKENAIDENLLDDISLYIDDMRLLKNIVNEYKIYFEKLTKETNINLTPDKLISFVVYKNLYPEDFAKLHKNEGMVYKLFNSDTKPLKERFIEKQSAEIIEIKKNISKIEELNVTDIYDLRRLYILKIFEKIGKRGTYINLSEKYSIDQVDELIKDNVFQEIINQSSISYIEERYNYGGYVEMGSKDSKVKVEQIDKEIKYFEKADLIANKKNNEVDKYNKRIQSIKVDINAIRRSPIAEVLKTSNNVEDINEELRKSDVLIYLIRRGFIAEDYFDYISIFYDITTTRNDKNFILSIRDNKPLPIDFKLNKVEALVKKIKGDYGNEASLNIDLVDFILMKEENDSISILFQQFNNNTERTNNFIETYLLNGKYVSEFINSICALYEGFWDFIENSNLTDDDKDFVFKGILLSANNLDIVNLNKSSKLSNYISKKTDFLNLINETSKKVEEILLQLNVKFKYPLDAQANKELYDFIYQNSLYEINENVIEQVIIEQSEENIVVKDLKKSNYTTILNSKCSQLITYINQNISIYINNVFLKIDLNVEESEKNIIGLLNNKILTDEDKFLIIDKEDFVINQLDDIDDNLISIYLIQKDKVKPTWENIIRYCGEDVFDDKIINYLNKEKHYSELSKNNITDEDMEDDFKNTFIHNLITANSLTNEAYKSLLQIIDETIDEINFELLGEDKIEILVRMDFIELNEVNMEKLRKDSAHKQVTLVELNFEKYIKQRDDDTVDDDNKIELTIDEIELLLSSPTLVDSNKIQLISEIEESQVTENLGNLLSQILIRNTLISISFDFLNKILKFSNNLDNKIRLCNLYSNMFLSNRTSIESVLNILGDPFSNIVLGGVKPPISSSQWNLTFIENLKKAGYIISYSVHDGKITKIRKNLES